MDANSHADQQGIKKLIPSPDKKEANAKSLSYENQVHVAISKPSSDNTVLMEANDSTFADQPPTNKHCQVQSNSNPHIVYHKKPSQSLQSCDTTCNTHPAIMSKQSPDQPLVPYPINERNAKGQNNGLKHEVSNTQSHSSDDDKQQNMFSRSNSRDQNDNTDQKFNDESQIAKPSLLNTDTYTSESNSDFINTKPKVRKCNPMKPNKQKQTSPKCWEELDITNSTTKH